MRMLIFNAMGRTLHESKVSFYIQTVAGTELQVIPIRDPTCCMGENKEGHQGWSWKTCAHETR